MSDFDDFDLSEFDSYDDDEEILDNYDGGDADDSGDDDDDAPQLSQAEKDRLQTAYEKKGKQNAVMAVKAKKFTKAQRQQAIRWIGEAGYIQGIPALRKVFMKDKTPGMKEEAGFALGQLKTLLHDFEDPEQRDIAIERVEGIVYYDKLGKRNNPIPLIILEVVLVIVAIVLFLIGFGRAGTNAENQVATEARQTEEAPTWTPDTEDALRNDIQNYFAGLSFDANFYQQQLAVLTREETPDCVLDKLYNDSAYQVSEAHQSNTALIDTVATLNDIQSQMATVASAYASACANGGRMDRQTALDLGTTIINVQRSLRDDAQPALNTAGIEVTEQVFPTATPPPTATLDPAIPTATQDLSALSGTLFNTEAIISDMIDSGGIANQNAFNWQQVVDTSTIYRSGCNQPEPIIPADYTLAESLVGQFPQLDSAVSNLNIGIGLVRETVTAFYTACTGDAVPEDAAGRLAQANLALSAFESARNDLDALQGN